MEEDYGEHRGGDKDQGSMIEIFRYMIDLVIDKYITSADLDNYFL